MKFIKNIKAFLYKTDFFYTAQLLRYKDQPEYRTLFGGVLSLLIIIGLIATFYNKIVDTLDKVVINSVSSNTNAADPPPFTISTFNQDHFMFGVEIWHHDLNTGDRYFDVVLTSAQFDTGQRRASSIQYPLQPCQRSHWEGFPEVQSQYDRLYMNYWLCLPKNTTYNIQGKYASVFSQTLEVAVKKCTNSSKFSRPCADQAAIDQYFIDNDSFFFTIYFINPLINPTDQKYLTFYLEDNNYIIFTEKFGAEGVLFMEQYQITTDQSILPFTQTHQNTGGIVTQFALKNPYQVTPDADTYCSFSFFKSGIGRSYNRQFQKLDQILSYIGGLFGTIGMALFIVNSYNTNCFQITLGALLFQNKNKKQTSRLKNYNFWNFLTHLVYILFNTIGLSINWQKVRKFDECKQQMKKQLDIRFLLQRVFFLQKSIRCIFEDYQLKGLHLHRKMTLQQAKINRKNFKIKRQIFKKSQQVKKNIYKIKSNTNTNSMTQQSMDIIQPKIYDCHKLADFNNQTKALQNSSSQNQSEKYLKQPEANKDLKNTFLFQQPLSSDQDSSDDQNNQFQLEVFKLKQQSKKGDSLSYKIWQNIQDSVKKQIQLIQILNDKKNRSSSSLIQNVSTLKKHVKKRKRGQQKKISNLYATNQVYPKDIEQLKQLQISKQQSNKKLLVSQAHSTSNANRLNMQTFTNQANLSQNKLIHKNSQNNVILEDQMPQQLNIQQN